MKAAKKRILEIEKLAPSAKVNGGRETGIGNIEIANKFLPVGERIPQFPTTRYYGSKRSLLPWMSSVFAGLKFRSAIDLFGGTAIVSLLLKSMNKQVTYHDGLNFNRDVARTLLSGKLDLSHDDLCGFLEAVEPVYGLVSRKFKGVFFTDDENRWIDGAMRLLQKSQYSSNQKSELRYLIYQACLKKRPFNLFHRANLNLRTAKSIQRSFGNAYSWERSFDAHIKKAFEEVFKMPRFAGEFNILPSGNVERICPGYDLVYLDPPYFSKTQCTQNDGYWRKYHFLEGLSKYSSWERHIEKKSKIKELSSPKWVTSWSNQMEFQRRLFELITRHRESIVVLSYLKEAFPSQSAIEKIFEENFASYSVHSTPHTHVLSKQIRRELLFIGHP